MSYLFDMNSFNIAYPDTSCVLFIQNTDEILAPCLGPLRLIVGTLTTTPEEREFSVQLIEGRSPFRIQGQRDRCVVGIRPLSAFGWQQWQIHRRMRHHCLLRHAMLCSKSHKGDEQLGKWPCGALCSGALTRPGQCCFDRQRGSGFLCLLLSCLL